MQSTQLIIAVSVLGAAWAFALGMGLVIFRGKLSTGNAIDDTHDDAHGTRTTSGQTTPTTNDQRANIRR